MRHCRQVVYRDHDSVLRCKWEREISCEKVVKPVNPREYRAVHQVANHQAHPPKAG